MCSPKNTSAIWPGMLPSTMYGLGLYIRTVRGLRMIDHGGGEMGHRSHFGYYPDLDGGPIVLSNHGRS